MKKTYMKPGTEVVNLRFENILEASVKNVSGLDGVERGGVFAGGEADGKVRGSRTSDDFDDLW